MKQRKREIRITSWSSAVVVPVLAVIVSCDDNDGDDDDDEVISLFQKKSDTSQATIWNPRASPRQTRIEVQVEDEQQMRHVLKTLLHYVYFHLLLLQLLLLVLLVLFLSSGYAEKQWSSVLGWRCLSWMSRWIEKEWWQTGDEAAMMKRMTVRERSQLSQKEAERQHQSTHMTESEREDDAREHSFVIEDRVRMAKLKAMMRSGKKAERKHERKKSEKQPDEQEGAQKQEGEVAEEEDLQE